jgi:type IV secretory pathway ATPase VirB11/archaellum biosynthesis ATPase/intein/homing endonuclease
MAISKKAKRKQKTSKRKTELPEFKIFKRKAQPLPEVKNIKVRYALIPPFAGVNIGWDQEKNEMVYKVSEPELTDSEKQTKDKIVNGLLEVLDIELSAIKNKGEAIGYLEGNVKKILEEYQINLSNRSYLKIMYYIFRDFVGLNEIEPILQDPYIEDISCDGVGIPIYVVHRRYGSIKTNVVYNDIKQLTEFVVKIAERSGRFISYAEPLLDGSLPDGSRVQASFAKDVTTRGPSFTIRKFSQIPLSPIDLINRKTVSSEVLAYLWLAVENGASVLIAGGAGTGKTTILNVLSMFIPPTAKVVSIEDSVTGDSKIIIKENEKIRNITIKEFVDKKIDAEVMTLDEKGKIIWVKPSSHIKHKVKKDIYEVLTSTGRKVKVTQDHSLFTLGENNELAEIKPYELKEKESFIAVPRSLPILGTEINQINIMHHLEHFKEDFIQGEPIKKLLEKNTCKELKIEKERYRWWKKHNIIKIEEFLKLNVQPFTDEELKQLKIKSKNTSSIPIIFKISKEFLEFCGLWLGDGSYDNYNRNAVIISNIDYECREIFKRIANYIGANYSLMSDKGVSLRLHSTVFYKFMKNVLKFNGYSNTKKIPEFIFNLSNDQIKHFIRGYFSADGCVKKNEVSCASQSLELLETLQTLFLRLDIIVRINDFNRKDKCINMSISSFENINKYKEIGFLQERKNLLLGSFKSKSHHTVSDVIPLSLNKLSELNKISYVKLQYPYMMQWQNIGREYMQKISPNGSEFNDLSHNDILWDKVKKIKKVSSEEIEVFDLTIPKHEKFICNNIIVHNTRELNLTHENWVPAVTRISFMKGVGEVSMFDLLRASFRQTPDYVIVGEIRGKEAYVMFQGMASGIPAMGTMHAGRVEDVIYRLETPPINLSPSLVDTLDLIIIMTHAREKGESARRVKEIDEIQSVDAETGKAREVRYYYWLSDKDDFGRYAGDSWFLQELSRIKGQNINDLRKEIEKRKAVLDWMQKKRITYFKDVALLFSEYYKDPKNILERAGVIKKRIVHNRKQKKKAKK